MTSWLAEACPATQTPDSPETQKLVAQIHHRRWSVYRPANLEELWQQMGDADFGPDERIPYWVELWPSSFLLSEWLVRQGPRIGGLSCLDVGCGLGLSSCVAASAGARVTGLDYALEALRYAGYNARVNGAPEPLWVQMDWRFPGFKRHCFDLIWGADIFYEKRFAEPLISLFSEALAPGGRIWLAEPERSVSSRAWDLLRHCGYDLRQVFRKSVPTEGYSVNINIWEAQQKEVEHG